MATPQPRPSRPLARLVAAHAPRESGEPTGSLVRAISILVCLLRSGSVDFAWYKRSFEMSERAFTRDLQYLRSVGDELGIRISHRVDGRVRLEKVEGRNRLGDAASTFDDALRAVARALGGPAARELGASPESGAPADGAGEGFLVYSLPVLEAGTAAAEVFEALKQAHAAGGRVSFRYAGRDDTETLRTVEPYRVVVRGGRYFLIGYDVAPRKGWRYFALDRIAGKPQRAGSFTPRAIPEQYSGGDAIGMLHGGGPPLDVTVHLSPQVAASTISRRWQRAQKAVRREDGSADITFTVTDVDEVVRWAFGFGTEAQVIAPPPAAAAAARTAAGILRKYERRKPAKRNVQKGRPKP